MNKQLAQKEATLKATLLTYGKVAVAYSGGVDSTLLLDVAHEVLGENALAVTACMVGLPKRELLAARSFCTKRGVRYVEVPFNEFAVEGFAENPPHRCYLCKHALLTALLAAAAAQNITTLAEGSNVDDEADYRPGAVALAELDVVSPLKACGFTKECIRTLSKKRRLPTWNKPACACLATRLPVGARLSPELLARISRAEEHLQDRGARQVRVRVHGDLARIELDEAGRSVLSNLALQEQVHAALRKLGFRYVTLDLGGYCKGSMNEVPPDSSKGLYVAPKAPVPYGAQEIC